MHTFCRIGKSTCELRVTLGGIAAAADLSSAVLLASCALICIAKHQLGKSVFGHTVVAVAAAVDCLLACFKCS